MARYTRNDRRESRNADLRRGQRHRPDRQLPVPEERRRHRRPHLDAERRARCGTSAPAGSGSASRTCGSTKDCSIRRRSDSRSAVVGLFGGASYFPLFDFDTHQRHRRQPRRQHHAHHLLVPADLHAGWRATTRCAPATTCASTTSSARTPAAQAGDYPITQRRRVHAADRTTRPRRTGQDVAGFLTRVPDRRLDRDQRRRA